MKRVLIIGGGVIGLCTAYYAAKRGHAVIVLERNSEDAGGCSFGNAGMIVPSHFVPLAAPGAVALGIKWMRNPESPFYIKPRADWDLIKWGFRFWKASNARHVLESAPILRDLHFASRALFEELADLTKNEFVLEKRGLLMLCKTNHALDEEAKAAAHAVQLGVPADVLDANQTAALDPNVRMDIAGAVYFPKDCHLTPGKFMAAMRRLATEARVHFSYGTSVTHWQTKNGGIAAVETSNGKFEADEFVLCGGSWSPEVARDLRLKIPMQAGKGYSLTLTKPRQLSMICSIFTEARIAVTPMGSSLRFGGTMEIAGLNEDINPVRVQGIIKAVPKYYPEFRVEDFANVQPWRGLRPCSPDGLPYLGRTAKYRNLCVATGHAMMGLSLGPISGKIVAEILSGEKPSIELRLLDPDRYNRSLS
jgi:D-amino-acid dehydrogenase